MPDAGCRSIADIFNRRFAVSRKMTVGKTFVADTLRRHRYEIEILRRKIKHRVPQSIYHEDQKRVLVRSLGRFVARLLFAALKQYAVGNQEQMSG